MSRSFTGAGYILLLLYTHFAVEMCDSRRQHVSRAIYVISRSEERGGVLGAIPKTPIAPSTSINDRKKMLTHEPIM